MQGRREDEQDRIMDEQCRTPKEQNIYKRTRYTVGGQDTEHMKYRPV